MSRSYKFVSVIGLLALFAVGLFAAGAGGRSAIADSTPAPTAAVPQSMTPVTLFLGYIHNVQFAPVYVALERGYFKDAGIDLTMEPSFNETDGLTRIGTGALQFGLISGEQVILARAQNAPVVYVFRWYQRFPVGIVTAADSGITKPEDLKGRVVGVPGKYGASYVGLQALLNSVGLKETDLKDVKAVGFDTAPVVCAKQVDASVIYIANEPAQIEAKCFKVTVIKISDYANIMSNGLVTNEKTIADHPELVKAMTSALAHGLADTLADPKAAFTTSLKYVEGLKADDIVQMDVLTNSLDLWKTDKLGYSDPAAWKLTLDTLKAMGLVTDAVDLAKVYSNDFLPDAAATGK